jgi:hypothetical protein
LNKSRIPCPKIRRWITTARSPILTHNNNRKKQNNRINETITTDGTRFFPSGAQRPIIPFGTAGNNKCSSSGTVFLSVPPTGGGDVWAAGQSFSGEQLGNDLNKMKSGAPEMEKKKWQPDDVGFQESTGTMLTSALGILFV